MQLAILLIHNPFFVMYCLVAAEVGNYFDELVDQNYLSNLKLLPNQTPELESKIMEHHREHMSVVQLFVHLTALGL
jgi:hypothetical protein